MKRNHNQSRARQTLEKGLIAATVGAALLTAEGCDISQSEEHKALAGTPFAILSAEQQVSIDAAAKNTVGAFVADVAQDDKHKLSSSIVSEDVRHLTLGSLYRPNDGGAGPGLSIRYNYSGEFDADPDTYDYNLSEIKLTNDKLNWRDYKWDMDATDWQQIITDPATHFASLERQEALSEGRGGSGISTVEVTSSFDPFDSSLTIDANPIEQPINTRSNVMLDMGWRVGASMEQLASGMVTYVIDQIDAARG